MGVKIGRVYRDHDYGYSIRFDSDLGILTRTIEVGEKHFVLYCTNSGLIVCVDTPSRPFRGPTPSTGYMYAITDLVVKGKIIDFRESTGVEVSRDRYDDGEMVSRELSELHRRLRMYVKNEFGTLGVLPASGRYRGLLGFNISNLRLS